MVSRRSLRNLRQPPSSRAAQPPRPPVRWLRRAASRPVSKPASVRTSGRCSPVSTSYRKPPTATVSGISGCERTLRRPPARAAIWSSTTWNGCQGRPGRGLADPSRSSCSVFDGHRAAGVRDDQDPLHAEQVDAEHQRLEGGGGHPAARVAEDLGVAGLEAEHPQRVDPRVHAGHDGDAGVGHAVEAAQVEVGGELAVRRDQVVEVSHGADASGAPVRRSVVAHEVARTVAGCA